VSVVIPIKSFDLAKQRLGVVMSSQDRHELAEQLARGVILAAHPLSVAVVCADKGVEVFARALGAEIVSDPGSGLNNAVRAGVEAVTRNGAKRVVIIHADIPLAQNLSARLRINTLRENDALIVPDRRLDGTNVLSLPTSLFTDPATDQFQFRYGGGSFHNHVMSARAAGLQIIERRDHLLSLDIDTAEDLSEWKRRIGDNPVGR
jgi:2-phospho-L-lactate/phosphoenolpyruvate guanylyltransferase